MIRAFFIPILLIFALLSVYVGRSIRLLFGRVSAIIFYIVTVLSVFSIIWEFQLFPSIDWHPTKQYAFGIFLSLTVFLIVASLILFIGNITNFIVKLASKKKDEKKVVSRRKFVVTLGLGIASIPFLSMIHGMIRGKYNFRVIKHTLFFDDLPKAFDGYRITQISDIHSGSFDNRSKIEYAIDLINEQQSDVVLFTGDMVNNTADEMEQWKSAFAKLQAKDGLFSVLGNHDYGDYIKWKSAEEKIKNFEKLKKIQQEIGFDLLLNESRFLRKDGERIALLGVQNWGSGGFVKYGDLDKSLQGVKSDDFKILMSHDPSHWQHKVLDHPEHIHLTLSGHTHGMQFGIEIPGWVKWSPVQWRYKYWAGIYEEFGKYINVNRGFGFLAFPGRVGMPPEITVIELKRKMV